MKYASDAPVLQANADHPSACRHYFRWHDQLDQAETYLDDGSGGQTKLGQVRGRCETGNSALDGQTAICFKRAWRRGRNETSLRRMLSASLVLERSKEFTLRLSCSKAWRHPRREEKSQILMIHHILVDQGASPRTFQFVALGRPKGPGRGRRTFRFDRIFFIGLRAASWRVSAWL